MGRGKSERQRRNNIFYHVLSVASKVKSREMDFSVYGQLVET